jgi:hypothetical protein
MGNRHIARRGRCSVARHAIFGTGTIMHRVGTWAFGGFALGLFVITLFLLRSAHDFHTHSVSVRGAISGYLEQTCTRTDDKNRKRSYTCYQYVVRYEADGVSHESPVEGPRTSEKDRLGEAVELQMDPRTQRVFFAGLGPWIAPMATSLFGLACLGAAALIHKVFKPQPGSPFPAAGGL